MKYFTLIFILFALAHYTLVQSAPSFKCPKDPHTIKAIVSGLINSDTKEFKHNSKIWVLDYYNFIEPAKLREAPKRSELQALKLGKILSGHTPKIGESCIFVLQTSDPENNERRLLRISAHVK